jgi:hypothetical protein
MKIRAGFVSNSSSSSFILRGVKTTKDELIKALKISQEEIDECGGGDYEIIKLIEDKLSGSGKYGDLQKFKAKLQGVTLEEEKIQLDLHTTGNYFGDVDYENLIIGKYMGVFEDGEVTEIGGDEDWIDEYVTKQLKKIDIEGKIKTYVQMISNDNY